MKKITQAKLSELTGYDPSTFYYWTKKNTEELKFRFNALMLGARLLENGYSISIIEHIIDLHSKQDIKILQLKEKVRELEDKA